MAASNTESSTIERTVQDRFDYAVSIIRSLPKDGPFQPSNMMKLKFYGLFKQATLGCNDSPKPGFWDPTARAKWEAWTLCGDMSSLEAMKLYIRELEQISETMPQTEEVKEFLRMIRPHPGEEPPTDQPPPVDEPTTTNDNSGQGQEQAGQGQKEQSSLTGDDTGSRGEEEIGDGSEDTDDDDDDDVMYQDSYDNLPSGGSAALTTTIRSSGSAYHSTPNHPQPLPSDLTDFSPNSSTTYSPITVYTSPSAITPTLDSTTGEQQGSPAVNGSNNVVVAKEVRFSDTVTSLSYSLDNKSDDTSLKILEKVYDLHQKLQVLIQQFNNLVQVVNQQQQQLSTTRNIAPDDRSNTRRRRNSSLMLFVNHLIPFISILATSFFHHLITGSTSIPWWFASAVTICSVFVSIVSSYLFR